MELDSLGVRDRAFREMCEVPGFDGLMRLGLRMNEVTSLKPLTRSGMPALRFLDLSWNRLSGEVVANFVRSEAASGLIDLDLSHTEVNDDFAAALAGCDHLGSLVAVRLGHTHVTDRGVRELLNSPKLPRLRHVFREEADAAWTEAVG